MNRGKYLDSPPPIANRKLVYLSTFQFPFGFNCVDHYALLHRPPVFSHAELLCRLAQDIEMGDRESSRPPPISLILAAAEQFPVLLAKERTLRSHLIHVGVRRTERRTPEQSPENFSEVDVLRECQLCKTALFTSALTCSCSKCKSGSFNFFNISAGQLPKKLCPEQ